jgi:tellurite resistance protein TehA-like permease
MLDPVPPQASARTLRARLQREIRQLYPGYFALVMATGIIDNAATALTFVLVADVLMVINRAAFAWLLLSLLLRACRYPRDLWADLLDPRLVFSFFTLVAAAGVLGVQLLLRGQVTVAIVFWLCACLVWLLLIYLSFGVLTILSTGDGVDIIHGGWLIAIVGTESLALLGTLLAPHLGDMTRAVYVITHMLWGIGVVHYAIFITLFSYRLFFRPVNTTDMTPLLWVVMGAAAIATNAGSTLVLADTGVPFLFELRGFVQGMVLMLWAWGSWWIPLLVVFGIWKYVVRRDRLVYHPSFWSVVFPLGMYSVATYRLSLATDFVPLQWVPNITVWIAMLAWALVMYGTLRSCWRSLRSDEVS